MKRKIWGLLLPAVVACACGPGAPQLGKASLDEVIGAMTLEEKAHLVIGTGMDNVSPGDTAVVGETDRLVPGAAGTTCPIPRLGIPAIVLADGPAGLRICPERVGDTATYYCTHFPIATLLASTWNQDLVERVGRAIGNEALEYGVDVLLAPALNIHRNPLCGRNFEYYSEDPLLSGKMAAAYVRGVQTNGVGTSIKHFVANNQETNRVGNDSRLSQRALREIYLRGFECAVKEGRPWTVMSSYNLLNGTYTSEQPELLTTLLRDEWGYRGLVMTDWLGGKDAVAQMRAGNDMLQPGVPSQFDALVEAVGSGKLDEAVLDRNVRRVLELVLQSPKFRGYDYRNRPDLRAHAAAARQSAAEGMVLLKNDSAALPLDSTVRRVALFGRTSYRFLAGGTGSGNVSSAYTASLLDGLRGAGYEADPVLTRFYEQFWADAAAQDSLRGRRSWFSPTFLPAEPLPADSLVSARAAEADVALITLGRGSGEFADRRFAEFHLDKRERSLLEQVCRAFHAAGKRVVVVLNVGGVVETASWKALPDAILCAWQGGQEGGNSVVDLLSGRVCPSGRLPMTFPLRYADVPSAANFPVDQTVAVDYAKGNQRTQRVKNIDYTDYEENIYVGYRYYDSFDREVSYPFGYGLSYTTFAYGTPTVEAAGGTYTVRLTVTNTGSRPGKEVVQLYVSAPDAAVHDKPDQELKAFAKTAELQPGETATVVLAVRACDLASFDEASSSWVVDGGTYTFRLGASSRDIRATLAVDVPASTQRVNDILKPRQSMSLLKR